ncbi:tetratricopeptide repeat protein [Erythrobacter sp.]|uniref:tetratricopeptide repeat protein n=1 Tax=Erythrobacter sp. TaxID=1042 RepID=UPI001425E647|nr:tetratricopeptide repeat protein [Erythrobacter sp.]QIQ85470.1 MAG: tetratricopeptide repeat protein [Erythrobacter sp.]
MALIKTIAGAGLLALAFAAPAHAQDASGTLAAETLAEGRQADAIRALERERAAAPGDAAVLINLGIAYAQAGDEARAKDLFEAALTSDDVILLKTAAGDETDSRRLARKALRMLRDGEFRPAGRESLTLRD